MRITIEIDEKSVRRIQRMTGIKKKSPAIGHALEWYLREVRKKELLRKALAGETDYSLTNKELEGRARYDAH